MSGVRTRRGDRGPHRRTFAIVRGSALEMKQFCNAAGPEGEICSMEPGHKAKYHRDFSGSTFTALPRGSRILSRVGRYIRQLDEAEFREDLRYISTAVDRDVKLTPDQKDYIQKQIDEAEHEIPEESEVEDEMPYMHRRSQLE